MADRDAAELSVDHFEPAWLRGWREGWKNQGRSYFLTRFVILRLLGLIYFFAYLSLARQYRPLLGEDGLTPVSLFLSRARSYFGSTGVAFAKLPSLFWFFHGDTAMVALAWAGVLLSLAVCLGYANAIVLAVLWFVYLSFSHLGQNWYSFGWEMQLSETGFLAIFLVPLWDGRPFGRRPPPTPVLWLFRWLSVRAMLGAGLIKLRGDPCWTHLSCLDYHFETQPIPNPLSPLFHFAPRLALRIGVLFNHVAELIAPLFVFARRRLRMIAGSIMIGFQLVLILSGNLSFLNWLTIVPMLACFDDDALGRVLPKRLVDAAERAKQNAVPSRPQRIATIGVFGLVAFLSIFPVMNMLSSEQAMNRSFDPLDLVNTYGAFGSVGKERQEIVFEGTSDPEISETTEWKEYELPCKPGDVMRRPCVASPYHYRLDWLVWFAAMGEPREYPWAVHFVSKLLDGDRPVKQLLAKDPFPDAPPRYVRVELYRYEFAPLGDRAWWKRTRLGLWLRPVSRDDPELLDFLERHAWR